MIKKKAASRTRLHLFKMYMNFFLQNNITIVTTQDSYLIISHLWVTIRAFSIVT